jgi:hypothetical protein
VSRAQLGRAAVTLLAVLLAVLLWQVHPLLAAAPLIIPGAPALLLFGAGLRREDPYDVLHLYRETRPAEGSAGD